MVDDARSVGVLYVGQHVGCVLYDARRVVDVLDSVISAVTKD